MQKPKTLDDLRKAKMRGVPLELVEDVNENPLVATLFHDAFLEGFFDEHGYYPTGDEEDLNKPIVKKLDKDTKKAS